MVLSSLDIFQILYNFSETSGKIPKCFFSVFGQKVLSIQTSLQIKPRSIKTEFVIFNVHAP